MKRRKFKVVFEVEVDVEVDEDVVEDALSKDFKASHYDFPDAAAVAQHLAYNFVANRADLPSLDGFAQWEKDKAKMVGERWTEIEVSEEIE
jgi:hypothetical protein